MTTSTKEDRTETETDRNRDEMVMTEERMKIVGLTTEDVHTTMTESQLKNVDVPLKMSEDPTMTKDPLTIVDNPMNAKDTTKIADKPKKEKSTGEKTLTNQPKIGGKIAMNRVKRNKQRKNQRTKINWSNQQFHFSIDHAFRQR